MKTPPPPLSPAAQAVKDSVLSLYGDQRARDMAWPSESLTAAAVLVAAVKHVAPPERNPHGYTSEREEDVRAAVGELLGELLAIAAELRQDGQP